MTELPALKRDHIIESTWSNRRYQVIKPLGVGGFGRAYLVLELGARNRKLREWCLKVTADQESWHRECYFGELLRGHERAVQVEESFAVSKSLRAGRTAVYYLVSEYVEAGSLSDYLEKRGWKPWPAERVKREAIALLRLLNALHGGGMTHRDLTPANIFVTDGGRLKVGDWGIARGSIGAILANLDGRNWWFTPDNFRGSARDDVWMVAQLMAMLLSGDTYRPFEPTEVASSGWDPQLVRVISKAIGAPGKRYANAYEMLADLDERTTRQVPFRSLRGKNVCFTGKLGNATRAQARAQLELAGGHFHAAVGPSTNALVRGERSALYSRGSHGVKIDEADKYGTKIITESEFWRILAAR